MTANIADHFAAAALAAGCHFDQMLNFNRAGVVFQSRQLAASAAARLCDRPDGPTAVGYGGARGGGKTFWLVAQMALDDCQRFPGLKCLLLRKVGKSNLENFEDLRRRLLPRIPHTWAASRATLTFPNGSRIIAGHFQCEKDIDAYLGLEYDVIGIEEATTLTARKYHDIVTCNRTSKPGWRPRIYSTTNPGGVGHPRPDRHPHTPARLLTMTPDFEFYYFVFSVRFGAVWCGLVRQIRGRPGLEY